MINIQILEDNDIVTGGTWCRPLNISYSNPNSERLFFLSEHSGTPQNNMKWCEVTRILPAWLGSTVKQIRLGFEDLYLDYEFAIGDIPKNHTECLSRSEYTEHFNIDVGNTLATWSKKHHNRSIKWIKENDINYFNWASDKGYIKSFEDIYQTYVNDYYK